MNKLLPLLAGTLLLLSAVGCDKAQKAQETYSNLSKLADAGKNMETNLKQATDRRAERVKKGDTLSLPYKELQTYLPAAVEGYAAAEPSGQSMSVSGMSFSTAERKFTKGPDEVDVKIVDYNGANQLYQGASMMFSLNMESEDAESLTRTTTIKQDGVKGSATLGKKTGQADLTLAVGDRFLVTVSGTNQKDLALVESVAQSLDLAKLTKL